MTGRINPIRDQSICKLYSQGLSYTQVANKVGVTKNTVAGVLWRSPKTERKLRAPWVPTWAPISNT